MTLFLDELYFIRTHKDTPSCLLEPLHMSERFRHCNRSNRGYRSCKRCMFLLYDRVLSGSKTKTETKSQKVCVSFGLSGFLHFSTSGKRLQCLFSLAQIQRPFQSWVTREIAQFYPRACEKCVFAG
jgi:hypothetical protein